jgi:hypothetical protein
MLACVLLWCLLSSCSTIRLGYQQADRLVYWWLDGYVDFDASQKGAVKQDIARLLQWHRQNQLGQYQQFLLQLQRQLQGNLSRADLDADSAQIEQLSQATLLHAVPELSRLALSLKSANLTHLSQKFEANNAEFRKKNMQDKPEQRDKNRYKRVLQQAEDWFGGFDSEQEQKIRRMALARPSNNPLWLEERIERQQKILTVLGQIVRDKPAPEATQALIRQVLTDSFARTTDPARKAFFDAWHDATQNMVLAIVHDATPQQKAHAVKKVQGWLDDVGYLLGQGK